MKIKRITLVEHAKRRDGGLVPRFPSHENAYERLKQYKDDPNIYISMTEIDKVGVNPQSKYNTPIGIYTYPLKEAWTEYEVEQNKNLVDLPFQHDAPFVWALRAKRPDRVIDPSTYHYGKFVHDAEKLKAIFMDQYDLESDVQDQNIHGEQYKKFWVDQQKRDLEQYWTNLLNVARDTALRDQMALYDLWNLTRMMSQKLGGIKLTDKKNTSNPVKWNWLFRQLGYDGVSDKKGYGLVHRNEPMQAVFFVRDALQIMDKIDNIGQGVRVEVTSLRSFSSESNGIIREYTVEQWVAIVKWILTGERNGLFNRTFRVKATPEQMLKDFPTWQMRQLLSNIEPFFKDRFASAAHRELWNLYDPLVEKFKEYGLHKD